MTRRFAVFLLLLLLAPTAHAQVAAPGNNPTNVQDEWIVGWKPTVAKVARLSRITAARGEVITDYHFINATAIRMDGRDADRLRLDPSVRYVERNREYHLDTTVPNDALYDQQWNLKNTGQIISGWTGDPGDDIDAEHAWDITTGDSTLLIGVIDTGIGYDHSDLVPNIWTNPGETPGDGIDNDSNGYIDDVHGYNFHRRYPGDVDVVDGFGHGTHVAGIIAGRGNNTNRVCGVMWKANLVAIRCFNECGSGTDTDILSGIQYSIDIGCRITNNSYGQVFAGDEFPSSMEDAIEAAGAAGQLFVCAAGNDGWDVDTTAYTWVPAETPADNAITVGSSENSDYRSYFSNYGGSGVDLAAPGSFIWSDYWAYDYQGDYVARFNGTSMSSPHVVGVAGLIWSKYPYLSYKQVKAMIMEGVDTDMPDYTPIGNQSDLDWYGGPGVKSVAGGRLNAYKALLQPKGAISQSTLDGGLILTGTSSGTPGLSFTCTIRDSGGVPVPNVDVVFDFTNADSVLVCDNAQYSCATKKATATTDANGVANFYLTGKVLDCDGGLATLTVDGAGWGGKPVCSMDVNNNGGIDGGDLADFLALPSSCVRIDMNGSGGYDGDDLSIFLDHYNNDGTGGCTSPDTLCSRTSPQQSPNRASIMGARPLPTMLLVASEPGHPRLWFTMTSAGPAKVELFDVAGRKIANLFDGPAAAGVTKLTWSAAVPPGAYFARFTTGTIQQDRKMVILQ